MRAVGTYTPTWPLVAGAGKGKRHASVGQRVLGHLGAVQGAVGQAGQVTGQVRCAIPFQFDRYVQLGSLERREVVCGLGAGRGTVWA